MFSGGLAVEKAEREILVSVTLLGIESQPMLGFLGGRWQEFIDRDHHGPHEIVN